MTAEVVLVILLAAALVLAAGLAALMLAAFGPGAWVAILGMALAAAVALRFAAARPRRAPGDFRDDWRAG